MNRPLIGEIGLRAAFFRGLEDGDIGGGDDSRATRRRSEFIASMGESMNSVKRIFWDNTSFIIDELRAQSGENLSEAVSEVVAERIDMANRIVSSAFGGDVGADFHEDYDRELLKCFALERSVIDSCEAAGEIESDEADAMRVEVNMIETYIIEDKRRANIVRLLNRSHGGGR
jgi:hypothetical protein